MSFLNNIGDCQFDYRDSFKYFCLKNCVRQLLSADIEDSFAYINCVPCIYVYFSGQIPEGYTVRYNKSPLQDELEAFFVAVEPKWKCAEKNFECLRRTIDNQTPVIAAADGFYLPYKQHYKRYHGAHAIIIYGYDDISKDIYIIDCYDKDNYKGTLSYDDFFVSWSSVNPSEANPFSGAPINNVWSYMLNIDTAERTSEELVKNSAVNAKNSFFGRRGGKCFVGLDGLMRLKELLAFKINAGININLERLHKNLYIYLREKILFNDYLEYHHGYIKGVGFLLDALKDNLFCWNVFLTYILKLSVTGRGIAPDKFNALYKDILYSERELYNRLADVVKY